MSLYQTHNEIKTHVNDFHNVGLIVVTEITGKSRFEQRHITFLVNVTIVVLKVTTLNINRTKIFFTNILIDYED